MSWLEDLEARLSGELEEFLRANPSQRLLVEAQERRDRLERLTRQRQQVQQQAEHCRQGLLQLATEIRRWQERVQRARAAAAEDLAGRAEAHVATLMEQGRHRWQELGELGQRFNAVEWSSASWSRRPLQRPAQLQPRPGPAGTPAAPACRTTGPPSRPSRSWRRCGRS